MSKAALLGMEKPIPSYQAFIKAAAPVPSQWGKSLHIPPYAPGNSRASSVYSGHLNSSYPPDAPPSALFTNDLSLQPTAFNKSTSQLPDQRAGTPPMLNARSYSAADSGKGSTHSTFKPAPAFASHMLSAAYAKSQNSTFQTASSLDNHSFTSSSVSLPVIDMPPPEAYRESHYTPPPGTFDPLYTPDHEYMEVTPASRGPSTRSVSPTSPRRLRPNATAKDCYFNQPTSEPSRDRSNDFPMLEAGFRGREMSIFDRVPRTPYHVGAPLSPDHDYDKSPEEMSVELMEALGSDPTSYYDDESDSEAARSTQPLRDDYHSHYTMKCGTPGEVPYLPLLESERGHDITPLADRTQTVDHLQEAESYIASRRESYQYDAKPFLPPIHRGADGKYILDSPLDPLIKRPSVEDPVYTTIISSPNAKAKSALPTIHRGPDGKYVLDESPRSSNTTSSHAGTSPTSPSSPPALSTATTSPASSVSKRHSGASDWLSALIKTQTPRASPKTPKFSFLSRTLSTKSSRSPRSQTSPVLSSPGDASASTESKSTAPRKLRKKSLTEAQSYNNHAASRGPSDGVGQQHGSLGHKLGIVHRQPSKMEVGGSEKTLETVSRPTPHMAQVAKLVSSLSMSKKHASSRGSGSDGTPRSVMDDGERRVLREKERQRLKNSIKIVGPGEFSFYST